MNVDEIYLESVNKAKNYKYLYHFTSFDNLKKIIANQTLRLSRITELNDPIEAERVTSVWHDKCFILSFTNTLENCDYFWREYAPNNGVCIVFCNENIYPDIRIYQDEKLENEMPFIQKSRIGYNRYDSINDWGIYDITKGDVIYVDDIKEYVFENRTEISAGLVKSKNGKNGINIVKPWKIESETRIRVAVRPIGFEYIYNKGRMIVPMPPFKYIYMRLPKLERIIISPYCVDVNRREIEDYLLSNQIEMESV